MAQIVKGSDIFKDFYRTALSFLKPLLLLLGLLLSFSPCIADEYIGISPAWDEYMRYKTYYFENGLDNFNKGQYKQAFKNFRKALENKKVGLKNSCKNPQNLAMKKLWKLCNF
uniref:Tetratricopeptide repeat protein n=1 Tax=Helicobacter pylori TaxID=210 RepID=A0A2Z2P4H5_HELPX|nr:hypothetical protein [Helicobacter pylori]